MQVNPFSSCFVGPESCPFQSPTGMDMDSLLSGLPGLGQILGPHGSGKSTLAFVIGEELKKQGRVSAIESRIVRSGEITSQSESLPQGSTSLPRMCIIDGIESLNTVNRNLLLWHLRKSDDLVLLTTHRRILWVPTVYETSPDLDHFVCVVSKLQLNSSIEVSCEKIVQAFRENDGNYRTALMDLFDSWNTKKAEIGEAGAESPQRLNSI